MRVPGPVITLGVGAALAAVLLALSISATNRATDTAGGRSGTGTVPTASGATATASRPASTTSPAPPTAGDPSGAAARPSASASGPARAYAARVDGGGPFVALSIRGGEAIAYLCDGRTLEAWLWGELDGDEIILRGDPKASRQALLAGRLGGGKVSGAVLLGQRRWTFSAPRAVRPSGLYRATKQVRGANVVAGWVVLPDGRQVGMTTTDGGEPLPAPRLDPADGSARIDGTEITALPGDPANAPTWVVR